MCGFWHLAAVKILHHFAIKILKIKTLYIITNLKRNRLSNKFFLKQIQGKLLRHLPHNYFCFFKSIGLMKHLAASKTLCFRLVVLDILHSNRLKAPGMINQNLCINSKLFKKQPGIFQRGSSNIPHCADKIFIQSASRCPSHPPEVSQRLMIPELPAKAHNIKLSNANSILVRRNMLCNNIHGSLTQKEVGSNSGRCGNSGFVQHLANYLNRKLMGTHLIKWQVRCRINKNFINRINVNILRRKIAQVNIVDSGRILNVKCHTWRCHYILKLLPRLPFDFASLSLNLKKPRPPAEPVSLKSRRYRKTNSFTGATLVRHNKLSRKRVEQPFPAFHRGIKRF